MTGLVLPGAIPSPTVGALHVGPLAIRGYAMCILAGIVVAVWVTGRRLEHRGIPSTAALDVATWAVPFGIVGARIYHVITSPQAYFGANGHPLDALKIWEGGLGVWGAIALGAVGAAIGARRMGIALGDFADAAAPGILLAQAIGRWGNWFNNELYGGPTSLPWGLTIHRFDLATGRAVVGADGKAVVLGTFHPVFLYEFLFCTLLAIGLIWLDGHRQLARGQVFALYVAGYPLGRLVLELMRTDPATRILGQRLNVWTCLIVFALGLTLYAGCGRRGRSPAATHGPNGEKMVFTS
ncbi:MAG: prolipoprotein diacylglyceryl transferase [Dermatophilaceae bacterium]